MTAAVAPLAAGTPPLADAQFREIADLMFRISAVQLYPGKRGLIESRLATRLRALQLDGYAAYVEFVRKDAKELSTMVDLLTTNKTSFFREAQHFDFLREAVLPVLAARGGEARFWSAGCSSGEEPYTLGMVLRDAMPQVKSRILATDLSSRVLDRARRAQYEETVVAEVPQALRARYLRRAGTGTLWQVSDDVRAMVQFARLNLMESWPMKGPFDVILCRNVMIYFDAPTQERLVNRFAELLAPGGALLVGHSESLSALSHPLRYVRPATYLR